MEKKKIYWPTNNEYVSYCDWFFKVLYYIGAIKFNHKYIASATYYNDYKFRLWHPVIILWFVLMVVYKAVVGILLGIVTAVQFFVENEGTVEVPIDVIKKNHKA